MAENNVGKLIERLATITKEAGALSKENKGTQKYAFHGAEAVMAHLSKLMAENGVVIIPSIVGKETIIGGDSMGRYVLDYEFMIMDIDGNFIKATWVSEAPMWLNLKDSDKVLSDDKAIGKANTYAHKYFLMKLFMISSVEADDLDNNSHEPSQKSHTAQKSSNIGQKQGNPKGFDENALYDLITHIFEGNKHHHDNAIPSYLKTGVISLEMPTNIAAAAILAHRSQKEFGFNHEDISQIIGKAPEEIAQTKDAFYKVWGLIKKANAENPLERA